MALGLAMVAGGAILGGLSGAMKKRPIGLGSLEKAKQRGNFTTGLGTSTADGFTYNQNAIPGQQQAMATSGTQLNQLLSGGLAIDPNRQARYQQAFYDSRASRLANKQAATRSRANTNRGNSGNSGSLSALIGNQALNTAQQDQQNLLQNQSVLGGEALANQALQQDMARAGVYNNQLQQGFSNQLNAQAATQNSFNAQAGLDINFANQHNNAKIGEFKGNQAHNNFSRFGNIMNGAISGGLAGANMGQTFGRGGGSLFSTGGGGIGASASSSYDQAIAAGSSPYEAMTIAQAQGQANTIGGQQPGMFSSIGGFFGQ